MREGSALSAAATKCEVTLANLERFASLQRTDQPGLGSDTWKHSKAKDRNPKLKRRSSSMDETLTSQRAKLDARSRLKLMIDRASTTLIDKDISDSMLLNLSTVESTRDREDDSTIKSFDSFQRCLQQFLYGDKSPSFSNSREQRYEKVLNRSRSMSDCSLPASAVNFSGLARSIFQCKHQMLACDLTMNAYEVTNSRLHNFSDIKDCSDEPIKTTEESTKEEHSASSEAGRVNQTFEICRNLESASAQPQHRTLVDGGNCLAQISPVLSQSTSSALRLLSNEQKLIDASSPFPSSGQQSPPEWSVQELSESKKDEGDNNKMEQDASDNGVSGYHSASGQGSILSGYSGKSSRPGAVMGIADFLVEDICQGSSEREMEGDILTMHRLFKVSNNKDDHCNKRIKEEPEQKSVQEECCLLNEVPNEEIILGSANKGLNLDRESLKPCMISGENTLTLPHTSTPKVCETEPTHFVSSSCFSSCELSAECNALPLESKFTKVKQESGFPASLEESFALWKRITAPKFGEKQKDIWLPPDSTEETNDSKAEKQCFDKSKPAGGGGTAGGGTAGGTAGGTGGGTGGQQSLGTANVTTSDDVVADNLLSNKKVDNFVIAGYDKQKSLFLQEKAASKRFQDEKNAAAGYSDLMTQESKNLDQVVNDSKFPIALSWEVPDCQVKKESITLNRKQNTTSTEEQHCLYRYDRKPVLLDVPSNKVRRAGSVATSLVPAKSNVLEKRAQGFATNLKNKQKDLEQKLNHILNPSPSPPSSVVKASSKPGKVREFRSGTGQNDGTHTKNELLSSTHHEQRHERDARVTFSLRHENSSTRNSKARVPRVCDMESRQPKESKSSSDILSSNEGK